MKGRVVVLGQWAGRDAAALVVDGQLQDVLIDPPAGDGDTVLPGAILRGVVDRPVKGQGGVFVRLPGGTGFLRQVSGLAPGQRVIVQVTGTVEAGKAVPLSLRVLFKARLAIVTPGAPGCNISRRIHDDAVRAELQALAEAVMEAAPADHGAIVRSAAETADPDEVAAEITAMRDLAAAVMADVAGGPELLVEAPGAQDVAWRDWSDPAPDSVEDGPDAFARAGIPEMIDALRRPEVPLAGGGFLSIEPTRALVAVDVNTGADTSAAAGLKANIAAARELPRQLRLRGLGGQITIDFAPTPKKDRGTVEQVLRAAFKGEAAETTLAGWTPLGCFELQRKRDRIALEALL